MSITDFYGSVSDQESWSLVLTLLTAVDPGMHFSDKGAVRPADPLRVVQVQ